MKFPTHDRAGAEHPLGTVLMSNETFNHYEKIKQIKKQEGHDGPVTLT